MCTGLGTLSEPRLIRFNGLQEMKKDVVIIGAGLVGSLLSIYLSKRGYKVKVFERRGDMRQEKMSAGRSINLALSDRGLLALEKVGLVDAIKEISIPMHGRHIHNLDGSTAFQPYGKEGQYINSVSRATLNMKLMDLAEQQGVEIFFNHKCNSIDWKKNKKIEKEGTIEQIVFSSTKKLLNIRKKILVVADHSNLTWLTPHNIHIAAYLRSKDEQRLFCVFNFSSEAAYLTWYAFKENGNPPVKLYDHWTEQIITVGQDHEFLILPPYGFALLEG